MTALRKSFLVLCLAALLLAACASGPRYREIKIVHTNDLHGHVESASAVAAVARAEKKRNPNTLFLDAGDCITGTPLSTLYQGRPIFEIMSLMGYDAVALGNHEFDHGWQRIAEFREIATFPILCANATDPEGKALGDAPTHVLDVGGVKVGIIGLVSEQVPLLTTAAASKGCTFPSPLETAKRLVPELRKTCDLVVLLTHVGVEVDAALAGAVPGIDVVIGGHSHTKLDKPLDVNGVPVAQAWSYGRAVGVLDLVWDSEEKKLVKKEGRLVAIDVATMPHAADVAALVRTWEAQVEDKVGTVIGKAPQKLGKQALRDRLERIYKDVLKADFGYQNNGGIRADLDAGDVTIRDVWTILPFDNTMVRLRLTGAQLPKFAKTRLGASFDAEKVYVIATNSYVGDQRAKYFDAPDAPVEDTGLLMRDIVVDWVRTNGGFEPRPAADK